MICHLKKRESSTVFQDYALFPNLTVKQNVKFGLKLMRVPLEKDVDVEQAWKTKESRVRKLQEEKLKYFNKKYDIRKKRFRKGNFCICKKS